MSNEESGPEENNEKKAAADKEAEPSQAVTAEAADERADTQPEDETQVSDDLPTFSPAKVTAFSIVTVLLVVSVLLNLFLLIFNEAPAPAGTGPFPLIIALGMILVSAISLAIAFWAHHARSIYLKDGPALVPERWGLILTELTGFFELQRLETKTSLANMQSSTSSAAEKSIELLQSFLTLQEALSARDDEIARQKKGHDAKIFKRFLNRFIRVDRSLGEMVTEFEDPAHQKNYRYLKRIMQDALEECGVEEYWPDTGADYRDAGPEIGEDPAVLETEDPAQEFMIAEVVSKGYVIVGEGDGEVIVPARVSIYRINKNNEKHEGTDG